ncbi:MAG: hypothetical protein [Caudoviricetes sp.]|nr:MAG: hypothetical protein [Caudoviricetes sp.]
MENGLCRNRQNRDNHTAVHDHRHRDRIHRGVGVRHGVFGGNEKRTRTQIHVRGIRLYGGTDRLRPRGGYNQSRWSGATHHHDMHIHHNNGDKLNNGKCGNNVPGTDQHATGEDVQEFNKPYGAGHQGERGSTWKARG